MAVGAALETLIGRADAWAAPLGLGAFELVAVVALAAVTWALLLAARRPSGAHLAKAQAKARAPGKSRDAPGAAGAPAAAPRDHVLQGTFVPSTGMLESNAAQAYAFENENCTGCVLPLHRPTTNAALDKSCQYPYGDHFKGKKRLWEVRLQFKVKRDVHAPLRFGIELEGYVPLGAAARRMMGVTVAALRQVAGKDLYHSVGDDPKVGAGPHEKPVFTMPLWAFDQFVVTPEGEEAPDLTDPHFAEFGMRRADDRGAFIQEISQLELRAGPTYTFAFWGISQFLDNIKWEVQKVIPFRSIDFSMFCGAPPVHIVLYTLRDADGEQRHLQDRKDYFFRLAFWSSKVKPGPETLRRLMPEEAAPSGPVIETLRKRRGWRHKLASMLKLAGTFACCSAQRSP